MSPAIDTEDKKFCFQNRIKYILFFILTGLHIGSILVLPSSFFYIILALGVFVLRFQFFRAFNLYGNVAQFIVWGYLDLACLTWPIFKYFYGDALRPGEGEHFLLLVGSICLLIHGMLSLVLDRLSERTSDTSGQYWSRFISTYYLNIWVMCLIVVAFTTTILSYHLGITVLGAKAARLPFQLTGFLNYFRLYAVPFLFIILLDVLFEKKLRGYFKLVIIIYVLWHGVEMIVRFSKGQLLLGLIPLVLWAFYRGIYAKRYVYAVGIILLVITVFFPYIATARFLYHSQGSVSFQQVVAVASPDEFSEYIYRIYKRVCSEHEKFPRYFAYLERSFEKQVWVNNIQPIAKWGGSSGFHTHVLLGVPVNRAYSAGTTGLSDAYILLGLPFLFVTLVFFSVLSYVIDYKRFAIVTCTPAGQAYATFLLFQFLSGGMWLWLFKGLGAICVVPALFIFHYFLQQSFGKNL